jgi:hypothetical protein
MPFEVFKKRMVAQTGQPQVTIQRGGRTIAFNEAALVALDRPEALELLYDREAQVMGLRAVSKDAPHAYIVLHNSRGTTHMVAGLLFTKHCGIPTDVARRWPASMDGDVLCIDFKEPGWDVANRLTVEVPKGRIPGVSSRR